MLLALLLALVQDTMITVDTTRDSVGTPIMVYDKRLIITKTIVISDNTTPPDTQPTPPPVERVGYYVAPNGSGTACTFAVPCAATTGVNKTGKDTTWVRTGDYSGTWSITNSGKVVRAFPGEWPRLRGNIVATGAGCVIWGMEVYQTNPVANKVIGLDLHGVGCKGINNTVHDAGKSGIGLWWYTQGGEAYGNISYNNGTEDNLDHCIYFNNKTGTMRLEDNICFNNWAYGFHGYSGTTGELTNISLIGNTSFGGHGTGAYVSVDYFVGGSAAKNIVFRANRSFKYDGYLSAELGRGSGNTGLVYENNYLVGSPAVRLTSWSNVTQSGNTAIDFASLPTSGAAITVRPNKYEAGRGHVTIYNWTKAGSVAVDLSPIVAAGKPYVVRSVCDLANPKVQGTYQGGTVAIPMTEHNPPTMLGRSPKRAPAKCGGVFGVFLVTAK